MKEAEVKLTAKSGKQYTFVVNILTDKFFCIELNCNVPKRDLLSNFGINYYSIFSKQFRIANLNTIFEFKKIELSNGIRCVISIDNIEYNNTNQIISSIMPAGMYKIEYYIIGEKEESIYNNKWKEDKIRLVM